MTCRGEKTGAHTPHGTLVRNRRILNRQTSLLGGLIVGDIDERGNVQAHLACESE
jgi:hypothetical protein